MEETQNGLPLDYIAAILDMSSRISYELNLPESSMNSPRSEGTVEISVGSDEMIAGLLEEYFSSIGIHAPFRSESSIRSSIRKNEDIQRLESSLEGHSVELMRGLHFLSNRQLTQQDLMKDDESVLRLMKTMLEIRPCKRSSDRLKYSPRKVARRLGITDTDVVPFDLPELPDDSTLTTDYMGGVFDACGRHTLTVSKNATFDTGYSLGPRLVLYRSSLHPVTVSLVQDTLNHHDIPHNLSTNSDIYTFNVMIHGQDRIRDFYQEFGDAVQVSLPEMEIFDKEILPRFDEGLHRTKQGFFDILYLAEIEMDLFEREQKYDVSYFARKWGDEIDTYDINPKSSA